MEAQLGAVSFAYRRYFYLKDQSLCYRSGATAAAQGEHLSDDQLADAGEADPWRRRSPSASTRRLFEFELVSTTRCSASARRATAALGTTISAEWLQIKHRNTHQVALQILEAKEGLE